MRLRLRREKWLLLPTPCTPRHSLHPWVRYPRQLHLGIQELHSQSGPVP